MSIWGKLGGVGLGLTIGGPIGALLGAFAGHYLVDREGAVLGPAPRDVVLTTGLVALTAKMARADGVVAPSEIEAFERVVIVPAPDQGRVRSLFKLAQATTDGFEAYAAQLARTFAGEPQLLDDVLDGLFLIAKADGAIHQAELAYLRAVAGIFGRSEAWFETLLSRHVVLPGDPYCVLGADRGMSFEALKSHYRALVRELHPDREIARGLPPEAVRIATERLAAINAAWERIERERARPALAPGATA
jgi:DnaJ like chaperone protein